MFQVNDDFRAAVFWSLNDALDAERMEKQMDALLDNGLGCGFFHSRVGLVTPYMSREWMDVIDGACEGIRRRGAQAWLYDEDRWPSGYGGGRTTREHPELASMTLALEPEDDQDAEHRIATLGHMEREGRRYVFNVLQQKNGENPWYTGGAYPDTLNPEAVEAFFQCVHAQYAGRLSEYFGKELKGIFFDEPCYIQRRRHPSVPFTMDFPEAYQCRFGDSLLENLSGLFFDEGDYHRVRLNYYTLATERFIHAFTRRYQDWCRGQGLLLTGHFLNEDTLTAQTECIGAAMPHYAHMDVPGIDILGRGNTKLATVVQLTSVAEQLGKKSICECLGCIGHQSGPQQMKAITDWLNALGVSIINPHLTLYSMRGERKRDYPPNISWMQPWYGMGRGYFDHIARMSEAACAGQSAVDLLVIHPISSVWAEMSPLHRRYPTYSIWSEVNPNWRENFPVETDSFQKPFFELTADLYARGAACHFGDELILREHARVENGRLIVGRQAYRTVVVPPVSVLRESTLRLLRALADQAGPEAVIFTERWPDWICGGAEAGTDWARFAKTVEEAVALAVERCPKRICVLERMTGRVSPAVFVNQREWRGKPLALVANTGENVVEGTLRIPFDELPCAVDTVDGRAYALPAERTADGWRVPVRLRPGSSVLLASGSGDKPPAELLRCGADFRTGLRYAGTAHPPVRPMGDNLMPLDRVTFRAPGIVCEDAPLESLWNRFYGLPEGTPFEAEYSFEAAVVPEKICLMIEMARNLDAIELNGIPQEILQEAAEEGPFDFSFDRVSVKNLRLGRNVLVLRGRKSNNVVSMANHVPVPDAAKHRPTELEAVYLKGCFRVELCDARPVLVEESGAPVCGDVCEQGYPFYAGGLCCEVEIPEGARWMSVEADANGCSISSETIVSTEFIAPYGFDLTPFVRAGARTVRIELRNSLANAFGPLHLRGRRELEMLGPALIYDMKRYQSEPVLVPYGIRGVSFQK